MRPPLAVILIMGVALLGRLPAAAGDVSLESFHGQWRATEAAVEGDALDLEVRPGDLNTTLTVERGGFRLRWTALERDQATGTFARREAEATFKATNRPGVFAYDEQQTSLLGRLFASPATGNPLEGETLLWARLDGPTLIVFSLGLTNRGGFDLHRAAHTLEDGVISLDHVVETEDRGRTTIRGRLQPAGS
jgi:hypothetical protein